MTGDYLIGGLIAGFLVRPVTTLAHELGHAAVALRVTTGNVLVQVGRPPAMIEVNGERLKIRWSLLPMRGVSMGGLCVRNTGESTYLELCALALAGPAMTALFGIAFFIAMAESWHGPPLVRATLLMCFVEAVASVLINLDPREGEDETGNRRDGPRALSYFRAWQAGHGAPPRPAGGEYKVTGSSSGEPRP